MQSVGNGRKEITNWLHTGCDTNIADQSQKRDLGNSGVSVDIGLEQEWQQWRHTVRKDLGNVVWYFWYFSLAIGFRKGKFVLQNGASTICRSMTLQSAWRIVKNGSERQDTLRKDYGIAVGYFWYFSSAGYLTKGKPRSGLSQNEAPVPLSQFRQIA